MKAPSSSPRVAIIGIGNVLNYGAEAIVRGTLVLLKQRWPDCLVSLATARPDEAKQVLQDCADLRIIQAGRRLTPYRILCGVLRRFGIGEGSVVRMKNNLAKGHDILLSAGGDNYSEMFDGRIQPLLEDLVSNGERALRHGVRAVLWGASVGPFENPVSRAKLLPHLRRLSLITAREEKTVAYLRSIGVEQNVQLAADPAFLMKGKAGGFRARSSGSRIVVGLNVSLLSFAHLQPDISPMVARERVLRCVERLLQSDDRIDVLCVPHVVEGLGGSQDDHTFMAGVCAGLPQYRNRIGLVPRDLGAVQTKGILAECDAVVASRMHCCVGALSSGTPTLLITYSVKGAGMARYAYGQEGWCLPVAEMTPEVFCQRVGKLISCRDEVAEKLRGCTSKFEDDARKAGEALGRLWEDARKPRRR